MNGFEKVGARRGIACVLAAFAVLGISAMFPAARVGAEVCNLKVVTDANPDYSDIGSMIYSITSKWPTDKEKCWALWHWNGIARRQTAPMHLHGMELTDPIRQFNDYGFTMCSTVAGVNCGIWGAMGYNVKFWDISMHTVCEVEYDGRYHMYDSSLSAIYTLCDGKTVAGVPEIGAVGGCAASGGKEEAGHIAKYHCLASTSRNGFLTGADTIRSVAEEYRCFNPNGLKFRYYFNNWDLGHRYILNLRPNEVYTRCTTRQDVDSPDAVEQNENRPGYKADPAYFVPNHGKDPESVNARYRIRGNGIRAWTPDLANLDKVAYKVAGVQVVGGAVQPAKAGEPGEVIFEVQGANVITSINVDAEFVSKDDQDVNAIAVSTNNGMTWTEVWKNANVGDTPVKLELIDQVNGAYNVLVKVTLKAAGEPAGAQLKRIAFTTITTLNSKTQPKLNIGKNTVYVGAGEQTESIVFWPEIQGGAYKAYVVEEKNVKCSEKHIGYQGALFSEAAGEDSYVVFKLEAPGDITRVTYGGRFYNRAPKSHIDMLYSVDGGKNWKQTYTLTDTASPWDVIHYDKVEDIPAGTKSVLVKYLWSTAGGEGPSSCSIYAVRMEANYKPADATFQPVEVTFNWNERQKDYSLKQRSHTQLVEKVPFTYEINVGGADHPIVNAVRVNLKGAVKDVKYGYSDGEDVGGEKFVDRWVTYGTNLAEGKPYTCTVPSLTNWDAGDPDGKKLTDGVVGPPESGGTSYQWGAIWSNGAQPEITVDLGEAKKCGVFRIQVGGYPWWDAIRGEVKDGCEVLTSVDGEKFDSQGNFNFNLRWKDIPANHMWNDDERFAGHNFELIPEKPVEARYVRFKLDCKRNTSVSEVQVLDFIKYDPFDLGIALPDGKDRSDITQYNPKHTPMQPYKRPGQ